MTTHDTFQKVKKKNNLLLIILLFSSSFLSYSQIDSVDVNLNFTVEIDSTITDSLGNYQIVDVMNVNATIYDIDFMGEIVVTIYEGGTEFPLGMVKMTAQEYIDSNQRNGNVVTTKLIGLDPNFSFTIKTMVRNFQGANSPIVVTNYNL